MDDLALVARFPERPSDAPVLETPAARVYVLAPGAPTPAGTEALLPLPDGARVAYALREGSAASAAELQVDPFVRGNAFHPLHASDRAECALVSVAASRRMDAGPESERVFVVLRGKGLISLENGDTHRVEPNHVAFVRAGEPARLWSQGPDDLLAVVFQPRHGRAERRTLATEIARRRDTS